MTGEHVTGEQGPEPAGGWAPYEPSASSGGESPSPVTPTSYDDRTPAPVSPAPPAPPPTHSPPMERITSTRPSATASIVLVIAVIGLIAGLAATIAAFSSTGPDVGPGAVPGERGAPDVLSVDGFADLVDAIEEQSGSTEVFSAVLYPTYASVDVPEDRTSKRERSYYWNGELSDNDILGTTDEPRVDLADVDAAVFARLIRRAEALVDDLTTTYVIVGGRSSVFDDDGVRLRVFATNAYSESASVSATLAGKVVDTYRSTQ